MSTQLFIPHPEIENHYEVNPAYAVVTSDCKLPYFKWSRLIRKNYVPGHGFLGHYETERIDVRLFQKFEGYDEVNYEPVDESMALKELELLMVDDTETILHYNSQGVVQCIVTGVSHAMLGTLSEQYRQHYYEYRV